MTRRISERAREQLRGTALPPYLAEHVARAGTDDRYRCLAVAENKLMWDLLDAKANTVRHVGPESFGYAEHWGSASFREAISDFGGEFLWHRRIEPDSLVTMAGAGATLEALFNALCEPGEGVLAPTPSYAGYWLDLETRIGLEVIPVPTSPESEFSLTVEDLDRALRTAPRPIGALLVTTPSNPTGRRMEEPELLAALDWARANGLHVVVNELYGLSVFDPRGFQSVASMTSAPAEDVHLIWGFSKDFASSGLRCGVLASGNDDVIASVRQHAMFSVVSGDTQHLLGTMLGDRSWASSYLDSMRSRLRGSYEAAVEVVRSHGFGVIPAHGGMFVLADLRPALASPTWEAEEQLWRTVLDASGVNLTPGSACRSPLPGFFRICYATEPADVVVESLDRALSGIA